MSKRYAAIYPNSPFGEIHMTCDTIGLTSLSLPGQRLYDLPVFSAYTGTNETVMSDAGKAADAGDVGGKKPGKKDPDVSADRMDHIPATGYRLIKSKDNPVFGAAEFWLDTYFSGKMPAQLPPLHLIGSPFRLAVWEELLKIPYGKTTTYGALAGALAQKLGQEHMSAQTIGGAVGHNPISILVPCHRVLGTNGKMTGYNGGIDKKISLLKLENQTFAAV